MTPAPSDRPVVLRCPCCGATVALNITGSAWCLPCGRRMQPPTWRPKNGTRSPISATKNGPLVEAPR